MNKSYFFVGLAGKTQLTLARIEALKVNPLFVTHLEAFKYLTPQHTCIVIDDCPLVKLEPEQLLALFSSRSR